MFLRSGVDRRAAPIRHKERVGFQARVGKLDLQRPDLHQLNGDLLAALTPYGLLRRFAGLDMSPNKIPAVRIPPPMRMTMRKESLPSFYECCNSNRLCHARLLSSTPLTLARDRCVSVPQADRLAASNSMVQGRRDAISDVAVLVRRIECVASPTT